MKTQHHIPLTFKFPDSTDIEVIHEIEWSISNSQIEVALNHASDNLMNAITDQLKEDNTDPSNIIALIIGLGMLDSGQIDIVMNGIDS